MGVTSGTSSPVKTRFGVTMPILNQEYTTFPKMAKAAEDAGFDSVWDYEFYRNPFVIHGLTSQVTSRIALATGLATTINRTPFEMANAALDIDELSGGRTILGIGMGAAGFADVFTGGAYDHPAPRIREYIQAMRCAWKHFASGEPVDFSGKYHSFTTPAFNPFGGRRSVVREDIPVYVAALRPTMLKLAGEVADGVIGYMMTPRFVTEMVIPNITEGARRAGRDPAGIDIASETICSISTDRDEAYRRARIQVGIYMSYPVSAPLVDIMGLQSEREAVLQALMTKGPDALQDVVDDKLVDAFSITGTPDEARRKVAEYEGKLPHILLHTPYVPPLEQDASADAFANIVETFSR